jgi:glutathione S-transferase
VKLYVTPGSPYARMARIVVIEKGLGSRVEIIPAQTRTAGSPYYAINPSGRVPYLVCDDGVGMEESGLICAYLDHLDGKPAFQVDGWEARRLEGIARSYLDGLSVWLRELYRPPNERSPTVIRHEMDRAMRLSDLWEREVAHPLMQGPLNMVQVTLACALGIEVRMPELNWRTGRPKLSGWYDRMAARPSFKETEPPRKH